MESMENEKKHPLRYCLNRKVALMLAIFFGGMVFFGGINTFFAYTNEMEFCTSCHSMKINYEEYQETVHYRNASGVQATCSDCHVPKQFFPKLHAKIFAAKDVYHEIMGTVDTREKYEANRWDMASRVWAKMKASNSRECRNCHSLANMDFSAQTRIARKKHARVFENGESAGENKTCIDCHKGIAHEEPLEPDEEI